MKLAIYGVPQRTPLRAELIALNSVLYSILQLFPLCRPLHFMTGSLTSLYLVDGYLVRPHLFCYHKHRWLVAAIAQNLLSRTASVRLTKVRAHIGVSGNEAADALASQAHEHAHAESAFVDPDKQGPAWVQCLHGDELLTGVVMH